MTGFKIEIETDSASADAVMQRLDDRTSAMGLVTFLDVVVDPFLRNRIDERFKSEGDDVTGKWHPLERATELIRASYGFPPDHPINIRTDKMHAYLVGTDSDVHPNGMGATLVHPPLGKAHSVLDKKIKTAQSGSASPSTQPRPVLGVNENDLLFITSSLAAWIIQDII